MRRNLHNYLSESSSVALKVLAASPTHLQSDKNVFLGNPEESCAIAERRSSFSDMLLKKDIKLAKENKEAVSD
ncbi:hypothetical protein NPIL_653401 [Nephila pilipes]|uniref:Uncharacterized protein n=1 Tax=Nephila pilipes TaxID=299642 RepID=A0A8X6TS39_NEPPI|nr:hypothetical protein NPIL_653401 [Nephila pilipes]